MKRSLCHVLLLSLACAGCLASAPQSLKSTSNEEGKVMSDEPSASRPAPPRVDPVVHDGVRYEQDMESSRYGGDQLGGYLVAVDPATGKRLWMLKVYDIPAQHGAPFEPGLYFRSMRLSIDGMHLEIESEVGGKYIVDLAGRTARWVSGPDLVHQPELR